MSASQILKDAESRMKKTLEAEAANFATLRTGRANPALLDALRVEYYGQTMPINQLGTVSVPDAHTLLIQVWDQGALAAIEKAITRSELGLAPNNDGKSIRLNIPPLTQERRKDLVKQLHAKAEGGRVALRNIRRDANEAAKKDDELTDDDVKRAEKEVQKLLDRYVAELDALARAKEAELLES